MTLVFSPPVVQDVCCEMLRALAAPIKHDVCGSLSKITARICECTAGQSDTSTFDYNRSSGSKVDKLQLICSGRKLLEGHEVWPRPLRLTDRCGWMCEEQANRATALLCCASLGFCPDCHKQWNRKHVSVCVCWQNSSRKWMKFSWLSELWPCLTPSTAHRQLVHRSCREAKEGKDPVNIKIEADLMTLCRRLFLVTSHTWGVLLASGIKQV